MTITIIYNGIIRLANNHFNTNMKFLKKAIRIILLLVVIGCIFRGWIYRHSVTYQAHSPRQNYSATNPALIDFFDQKLKNKTVRNVQDIINESLSLTSNQLHFSSRSKVIDPNKLINTKSTHCVGYASFFATTCNYLLQKNHLGNEWSAQPQAGQLYLFGHNIHQYFNAPFFKDHDFVLLKNKKTGEVLAIDPSLYDYFFIKKVTFSK